MQSYKHVALKLHGLHEDDQRWLLSQLPAEDQKVLGAFLVELKELGIPQLAVQELGRDEVSEVQAEAIAEDTDLFSDVIRVVDRAEVSQIQKLAEYESAEILGLLVSLSDWQWKDGFLATRNDSDRAMIESTEKNLAGRINDPLRELILRHVAARISEMPASESMDLVVDERVASSGQSRLKRFARSVWRVSWQK